MCPAAYSMNTCIVPSVKHAFRFPGRASRLRRGRSRDLRNPSAMNSELQQFVRDCLARGIDRAEVRGQLQRAGWRTDEIDRALGGWAEAEFPVPVPRRRPSLSARETFLHLTLFVTLYVTAFNVGALLFHLVDLWLPDPVTARVDAFDPRA